METNLKLKTQLKYVLENSKFYQKKFSKLSIDDMLNDFSNVPFTYKKDILQDQAENPPFGDNLSVCISDLCRVHKTSGTTNKPVLIALTANDVKHIVDVGGKCFSECGLKAGDIVMHCLNYNMWAGGYTDHQNLEQTGAAVVPFGVGNTSLLIEMILQLKATAIHCTPSYLSRIEQVLNEEFNMSAVDLNLKLGLLGAESGLQNEMFRKNLESKWGFKAMNANYGMAEVLSMIGSECSYQRGLHYRANDKLLLELIDSKTERNLPIEKGTVGEMVFTNLLKEAQPLVRYRSGDIIEVIDTECSCGDLGFIFNIVGRSDDMIVVRGLNVFISAFDTIIRSLPEYITDEYRVLINKTEPIDKVIIQVEAIDNKQKSIISEKIINKIKEKNGFQVEVEVLNAYSLERTNGKTKRLLKIL